MASSNTVPVVSVLRIAWTVSQRRIRFDSCSDFCSSGHMLQSAFADCLFPDLFAHLRGLRTASVTKVGGRYRRKSNFFGPCGKGNSVVLGASADLVFNSSGQDETFQENSVFQSVMSTFCGLSAACA